MIGKSNTVYQLNSNKTVSKLYIKSPIFFTNSASEVMFAI